MITFIPIKYNKFGMKSKDMVIFENFFVIFLRNFDFLKEIKDLRRMFIYEGA